MRLLRLPAYVSMVAVVTGVVVWTPCECGGRKDSRAKRCSTCVRDPELRFWRNVVKTEGCWEWIAFRTKDGYGRFRVGGGKVLAHRFAYELLVGPIPEGLESDHLCRNRGCVNPAHLEPVTQQVNRLRGVGLPALSARKTHCKNGHPFNAANTYHRRDGDRECRTCKVAGHMRYSARRRAASAALKAESKVLA